MRSGYKHGGDGKKKSDTIISLYIYFPVSLTEFIIAGPLEPHVSTPAYCIHDASDQNLPTKTLRYDLIKNIKILTAEQNVNSFSKMFGNTAAFSSEKIVNTDFLQTGGQVASI